MTKDQILHQWNEWWTAISAILGTITGVFFEEKYSLRQMVGRLIVGGISAAYLGAYFATYVDNQKAKGLIIFLTGVGGYYIIKAFVKIAQMFGLNPQAGVDYVLQIFKSVKGANPKNTNNENSNENAGNNPGN